MQRAKRIFSILTAVAMVFLTGCMPAADTKDTSDVEVDVVKPEIPEKLETGDGGVPVLKVYDADKKTVAEMDLETYVMGVLAGEMKNDWPLEALKAQAILARTFVLKFVETKSSKYDGADISTDVSEAQAYNEDAINDKIRQAVSETRGLVMSYEGELPQAWFHAHAGGMTELPSVALEYKEGDPEYLEPVESPDSKKAPEDVQNWTAEFTAEQVGRACKDAGVSTGDVTSISIESRGESGRAKTLSVNGVSVSAPALRLQIGANKLKSTLIDEISMDGKTVTFTGRGFGHGVGMSQWGAYGMAEEGKNASDIVRHYFDDVDIVRVYGGTESGDL